MNLESAAARGNQRERFDALAELKNFRRQTDGLRRVVSNDAVFDRDLGLHRQTPFRERSYRRDERRSRNAPTIVAHVLKLQLKSVAAARSTRTAASPLQQTAETAAVVSPEGVNPQRFLEGEIEAATDHAKIVF